MAQVIIESVFDQISESEIKNFESQYDVNLPNEYKKFLLEQNGGFPSPGKFLINEKQGKSTIDFFYGFSNKKPSLDIIDNYIGLGMNIRKDVVPIGEDPGGNRICIGISDNLLGKIYFWDHEMEAPDNLYLIANSFTEFLEKLH